MFVHNHGNITFLQYFSRRQLDDRSLLNAYVRRCSACGIRCRSDLSTQVVPSEIKCECQRDGFILTRTWFPGTTRRILLLCSHMDIGYSLASMIFSAAPTSVSAGIIQAVMLGYSVEIVDKFFFLFCETCCFWLMMTCVITRYSM